MDKPIVQLFRTPNRFYCYDAVTSQILPLNQDSFLYLSKLMQGKEAGNPPDEIAKLRQDGYFSTVSPVETIQHPYTKYLPLLLSRKLDHITLQVTQNCNFRCKYCVYSEDNGDKQRHHSPKHMSWETAKRAIDFLWEHSADSDDVTISFYGGEPLMEFALIRRCVEHARSRFRGKPLHFNLTTNSTLLTDEMIHYFAKNKVDIMISIDGPKEINDKNRVFAGGKGTFDTVMQKIQRVRELEPEFAKRLKFSMVMDPSNDFDCINSIEIECSDINAQSLMPSIVEHLNEDDPVNYANTFSDKFSYQVFLAWLAHLGRYPIEKVSPIAYHSLVGTLALDEKNEKGLPLQPIDCPSGPCVAGCARLFCNVDGDLFPCERVSETSEAMYLGSIFAGIDASAAVRLTNVGQITAEKCKQCWCFRFCVLCAKKADDGSKNLSAEQKKCSCVDSYSTGHHLISGRVLQYEAREIYAEQLRKHREREENV